jgi:WhiB family redox-sensing transcriptional regulator
MDNNPDIDIESDAAAWNVDAECAGMDPELFFPGRGESTKEIEAVCNRCPISEQCLDHALRHGRKHGIWGGTSERQRRMIRTGTTHPNQATPVVDDA